MANQINSSAETKSSNKKKKWNLYEFFSGGKDGKGVKKQDKITDFNVINFFKLYFRNFGRIVQLNFLFLFGNFPIFFYLFARSGNISLKSLAATNVLYSSFHGVMTGGNTTPVTAALNGILGYRTINYVPTNAVYVLMALSLLVIFTFGFVNVGTAYIIRNMLKSEPIFLLSDFFYAIRRNWKQALVFGMMDFAICALLVYDVIFFYYNIGSFFSNVCFYVSLFIAFLYFIMRFYIYPMMVTFDLSIFKMIKNAFIFAIVGIKRNILAVLGMVLFLVLCYALLLTYVPLGLLTPILLIFGTLAFIAIYAAYPKIKEIMIDPYYKEEDAYNDIEPVFRDVG
ncbi:MAG: DUF624 domain-containing protein [Clostridia bacterium]|nr:DUF624 domain-containing protein [Clostridia bacterium]